MKSFVFFKDNKLFTSNKIWRIEHIISRFRKTKVDLLQVGSVEIIASNDKVLQSGIIVNAKDEVDAIDIYEKLKKVLYV